jgi:hypothetical protein
VQAVMSSVGIVAALCAALGWCGYQLLGSSAASSVGLVLASFSPFTILTVLINPYQFGGSAFQSGSEDIGTGRLVLFLFGWIATAGYAAIVWTMYKNMVKNFDMTIRRQSR